MMIKRSVCIGCNEDTIEHPPISLHNGWICSVCVEEVKRQWDLI